LGYLPNIMNNISKKTDLCLNDLFFYLQVKHLHQFNKNYSHYSTLYTLFIKKTFIAKTNQVHTEFNNENNSNLIDEDALLLNQRKKRLAINQFFRNKYEINSN
jgi:hypothetical protein